MKTVCYLHFLALSMLLSFFFFSSRRRHTRCGRDWSSDVCSSDLWSWEDNDRSLVFFLRTGARWHDGTPVSSKDVKFTFDLLRETPDASARLRINPRRDWYTNVEAVEAVDPQTVVFRLRRPQPSLLLMLASGYTPIYAAHVPPASYRTGCVGTGPFR